MLLKEQAQEIEEDVPTRFAFNGAPLLMRAKGGDGFNWIMHNHWLTVAVNRSSKVQILGQVRCSSAYLWRVRDLGQIIVDVHQFLMSIFGEYIVPHVSSCDLAVDVMGLDFSSVQQVKELMILVRWSRFRVNKRLFSSSGLLTCSHGVRDVIRWFLQRAYKL